MQIDAVGTTIDVVLDDSLTPEQSDRLTHAWSSAPAAGGTAGAALRAGIASEGDGRPRDVTGIDFDDLASQLSTSVTLSAIEQQKGRLVMLHACGVASPEGEVIAFVGPSGRGKTTLSIAVGRTWGYLTDETVGIELDGTVHPYRKPLSVIVPSRQEKEQVAPADLDLRPLPTAPLSIAALVLLDRQPERAASPEAVEVELVPALVQLVPEMSYLPLLETPLQRIAGLIDSVGGVQRVSYRDAPGVTPLLRGLIARSPRPATWRALSNLETPATQGSRGFRRRRPLDAIAVDGSYVMLHGTEVRVLDGIGPALWDALDVPLPRHLLVESLVSRLGAPEGADAGELVDAALRELVKAGVLDDDPEHPEVDLP
jgi:hypothetical protein